MNRRYDKAVSLASSGASGCCWIDAADGLNLSGETGIVGPDGFCDGGMELVMSPLLAWMSTLATAGISWLRDGVCADLIKYATNAAAIKAEYAANTAVIAARPRRGQWRRRSPVGHEKCWRSGAGLDGGRQLNASDF